jgi:glucose-6-phosphate isomerase/transaldolase/glucose-6-phosphate isomerase
MIETALADLQRRDIVGRIWNRDHTVWKTDPTEISDRLGWLNVTGFMREQASSLQAFAQQVRNDGIRHVVLLGMGGSSLGPEVIRQTFGSTSGFPRLLVLDSTIPDAVQAMTAEINPSTTLFLVSSKSGTTTESLSFYRHFRGLVEQFVGKENAGPHFIAITDPETPLEVLAQESGFRQVFTNPPDIGGRYSVLSYFGLVPAALVGMDITRLLDRADSMRTECAPFVKDLQNTDNPGARLGGTLGILALHGRNKLTLVTSPSIESFGLWAEQLIAESTGKEERGIIPVSGEPLVHPANYGDDRQFVYLRLNGDENACTDAAIAAIESSGQPVLRLELQTMYDLGAEFFRWEFATVVAGAILSIHPFDQPNVQQAKYETAVGLQEHRKSGRLPQVDAPGSIESLLSKAQPGDYLAIMAYIHQTPETDIALADLRRRVTENHGIATTLGYGPRFLHSTGQLHKGGPDTGLFLQLTTDRREDMPIPGESYTFGILAKAQALGDLKVLLALERRVVRVQLPLGSNSEIMRLADEVGAARMITSALS